MKRACALARLRSVLVNELGNLLGTTEEVAD
jgi:hypothetical protein